MSLLAVEDPATRRWKLWKDAERFHVLGGQVRDFRLKPDVKVPRSQFFQRYGLSLGLGPDDQMVETVNRPDKWGFVQTRFRQRYKGLEVFGAEYVLQEKDGGVTYAIGKIANGLDLDITPQITEAQARDAALNAVGAEVYAWVAEPDKYTLPEGQLGISSEGYTFTKESFRLVYRFTISATKPLDQAVVDVDAKTGAVINKLSLIFSSNVDVPSEGVTHYNGPRSFEAMKKEDENGINYVLHRDGPPGIYTWRVIPPTVGDDWIYESFFDDDGDNYFGDPEDRVGVSVHWGMQTAVKYFSDKFGWLGLDGQGQKPIVSALFPTSLPEGDDSAFYLPESERFIFQAFPNDEVTDDGTWHWGPWVRLLTVGHEFTHGVHFHTADPVYIRETGALMEGFAEIFGVLIDSFGKGGEIDWCTSRERDGNCLLDVRNPTASTYYPSPDTYKIPPYQDTTGPCDGNNDYCGVHRNRTVAVRWFYFLVSGGAGKIGKNEKFQVSGIGKEEAADIAYLAMTTMPPTAGFMDVRLLSMEIAANLFGEGSAEAMAVANAWHAVGVGPSYEVDRQCTPPSGTDDVESWPVQLNCQAFPDEVEWEFQVSPSFNFDEETKTLKSSSVGGQMMTWVNVNLDAKRMYFWRVRGRKQVQEGQTRKWVGGGGGLLDKIKGLFTSQSNTGVATARPEAEAGWGEWSTIHALRTASRAPVLKTPASGASVHPWNLELTWDAVSEAEGYLIQVSTDSGFETPIGWHSPSPSIEVNLKIDTDYYWRGRAKGPDGTQGDWSLGGRGMSFKTTLPKVTLESPADNAAVFPWDVSLSGQPVSGAAGYRFLVSKNSDLSNPFFTGDSPSPVVSSGVNLEPYNGAYWWGVAPKGPPPHNELGAWSKRSMTADYQKTKAELFYPKNHLLGFKSSVTFEWKSVPKVTSYRLRFYNRNANKSLGGLISETTTAGTTSQNDASHRYWQPGSTDFTSNKYGYCWTAQALGPGGLSGVESDLACYDIGPPAPVQISPAHGATNVEYNPSVTLVWDVPYGSEYPVDAYKLRVGQTEWTVTSKSSGVTGLSPGTSYMWSVRSRDNASGLETPSGQSFTFTTKSAPAEAEDQPPPDQDQNCSPPAAPALQSPGCSENYGGDLNACLASGYNHVAPQYQWSASPGATQYQVTVTHNEGGPQVFQQTYNTNSAVPQFQNNHMYEYHWTVRAKNNCSSWSSPAAAKFYLFYNYY